jgi:hypothetical protein
MGQRLTLIIALATTLLLWPLPLSAQSTPNEWSALKAVAPGSKLEVRQKNGKTIKGTLSGVSDTALTLLLKNTSLELQRDDVFNVYQNFRKSTTTATLIGLGVGAGAGAAVGAAGGSSGSGFEKIDHAVTAGLTVVGAGVGALAGYLIGRGSAKRVLVYQSR